MPQVSTCTCQLWCVCSIGLQPTDVTGISMYVSLLRGYLLHLVWYICTVGLWTKAVAWYSSIVTLWDPPKTFLPLGDFWGDSSGLAAIVDEMENHPHLRPDKQNTTYEFACITVTWSTIYLTNTTNKNESKKYRKDDQTYLRRSSSSNYAPNGTSSFSAIHTTASLGTLSNSWYPGTG